MNTQQGEQVHVFDQYSLIIPAGLEYWKGGLLGRREFLIEDPKNMFSVSLDEEVHLMDMDEKLLDDKTKVQFHYHNGTKYLHQLRTIPEQRGKSGNYAFFHMELQNSKGKVFCLQGQMVAAYGYEWADDVEPVLKELLDNASILEV